MAKNKKESVVRMNKGINRVIKLLEWLLSLELYFNSNLDHHTIAKRLSIGTQRVTAILKGLKKPLNIVRKKERRSKKNSPNSK